MEWKKRNNNTKQHLNIRKQCPINEFCESDDNNAHPFFLTLFRVLCPIKYGYYVGIGRHQY